MTNPNHASTRRLQGVGLFVNLTLHLVERDFKGQYRRALLGPFWAILQPVAYVLLFTFLRGVFNISSQGVPYPVFAFSALLPWTFFANVVVRCGPSISSNGSILKKIAVPQAVFPLSATLASLVDFLLAALVLAGLLVWYATPLTHHLLWLFPMLLLTGMLALGLGLAVSAVGAFRRDVLLATPFAMQLWLLATPVMYPFSQVPDHWTGLMSFNPMTGIVDGFRTVLVLGQAPDPHLLSISLLVTLAIWLVAWPLFRYLSRYFADSL